MAIQVLSPLVVSKIAAGEVVERPASVVKELVENSLDAGATQIAVEVRDGGTQLIRVTDNGTGIHEDEIELAFERHATSKITSEEDIDKITTLGFRGEALPTIASVAGVSLVTRHSDDVAGTAVWLENGRITRKIKQGYPGGTSITVRDLFQNIPARLKFLKSISTENGHISHLVTQYVLAYPEVKFTLVMNGRTALRSTGSGDLKDAVVEAYGLETAQAMLEMPASDIDDLSIHGFIGMPSISRSNRNYLSFFVNRRWVQNRMLTYAVEEAYRGMLMTGKHPIVMVYMSIPPDEVDVNVHPTKREIRFRNERHVFLAVQKAVRETLTGSSPVHDMRLSSTTKPHPQGPQTFSFPIDEKLVHTGATRSDTQGKKRDFFMPSAKLPILRVIGQYQNTYILAEGPDGLYLIDQHAAHERILFERIEEQQSQKSVEGQVLLEPLPLGVTAQQDEFLRSRIEIFSESGFSLEPFGERTYLVRMVPAVVKQQDIPKVLGELLDSLEEMQSGDWRRSMAVSLACHGAIRAGQTLSFVEMEELIHQLEETKSPRTCPHGRPTMTRLSTAQLEGEFGRRR